MKFLLAWYQVSDLDKAKSFYTDTLGLKKTFEMPGWAEFANADGGTAIGVALAESVQSNGGATVVLNVDDLDATRRDLETKGVPFEGVEEIPGVVRLAMFRDPFGNRLQLAQVLQAS